MSDVLKRKDVDRGSGCWEAGVARAVVDHDALQAAVEADFRRFDGARIRDSVPVLASRRTFVPGS